MSVYSNPTNELNNVLLEIITTRGAKYISLHTGSPGTTGANEVVGGAYARVSTVWGSIANGSVTGSQVTLNVPITTIVYWGIWDAISGGNYYDGGALPSSQTYAAAGTYLLTPTYTAN
jgi:hypothetical protein